jgi:hypothetical protein
MEPIHSKMHLLRNENHGFDYEEANQATTSWVVPNDTPASEQIIPTTSRGDLVPAPLI